ncbi:MAG: PAS domain S-box protein [Acidobacteria bacterium]|nr:PAS domain S-box protein [Acidobacteriota bacterium]
MWNFIAGEEVAEGQAALREKLHGRRENGPRRRTYVTKQGHYLVVELRDRLIQSATGEVEGIRTTLVDITERVVEEESSAESMRWQVAILQTVPDAIVAVDGLGVIAHMNKAAEILTGWELSKARGEAFERVLMMKSLSVPPWCDVPLSGMFHRGLFEGWRGSATLMDRRGERTDVRIRSMPLGQEDNRVAGFVLLISRAE